MKKIIVYIMVLSIMLSNNSLSVLASSIEPMDDKLNYEESVEPTAEIEEEYLEEPEEDYFELETTTTIYNNNEIENLDIVDLEESFIDDIETIEDEIDNYEYEDEPEEDEVIESEINSVETDTIFLYGNEQKDDDILENEMYSDVETENYLYEFESETSVYENLIETESINNDYIETELTIEVESEKELDIKNEIEENETKINEEINEIENNELSNRGILLGSKDYRIRFYSDDEHIMPAEEEEDIDAGASYYTNIGSSMPITVTDEAYAEDRIIGFPFPKVTICSNQSGLTFLYWENNAGKKVNSDEYVRFNARDIVLNANSGANNFIGKFIDNRNMMTLTINQDNKVGNANLPQFDKIVASSNFFSTRQSNDNIITRKTKIVNENLYLFYENYNYKFENWTTSDGTIKKLTDWNANSDIELKANFEFVGYYVYFGEGVVNLDTYYIEKLKKGDTYILPMPTFSSNQDSTLFRWKDVNTNELFEPLTELTLNVDDNLEYEPYFIEKNLVKFNMQNHGNSINDIEVEIGQKITKPTTPTAIGYKFVDWYKEQNFINKWNFDTDVIENVTTTLYAKWDENVYDIVYVENGGTYIDGYNKPISRLYSESKTYPNSTQIKKIGNNFMGWYETENFSGSPVTSVSSETDSSKKLYARWEPQRYSVTLNLNGGEFIENNITEYTYGTTTNLPYNIKSPNVSENFVGWYEDSNFQGEKVSQITNRDTGNKTYYAKYGIVILKLNFNSNGGSGNIQSIDYDYGSNVIIPDNPYSKNGYEFISWIGSDGLNYEPNDEFNIYNDFTLTANWKKTVENIDNAKSDTSIERTFLWEEEKHKMWKAYDDKTKEYAKNQWLKLDYAGETKWYHFNNSGYMDLGWIKDNGKYYYLQTEYNNTFGGMLTGVKKIDGIIFHFADSGELINIIQ